MAVRPSPDVAAVANPTTSAPRSWAPPATTAWTPPSWEQIVRDHSARVYRLAYRLTGNSHDAEDLTQDVFVRVFRSLHTFQPGTFEGWLHRITTNLFLDTARRKQKIRFDGLVDGSEERLPSSWPTPSEALADAGLDHDVAAALAALAAGVPGGRRALRHRGSHLRGDRRGPGHEARHRTEPHPPRSGAAARRARPPPPDRRAGSVSRGRRRTGWRSRWQPASRHRGTRGVREGALVRRAGRAPVGLRRWRPG